MEKRTALINEPELLQSVFENSPAATMAVDKHATILLVNRELEQITGLDRTELEGKTKCTELVLSEDRDMLKTFLRRLKTQVDITPERNECRFVDRQGGLKTVYISGKYLKSSGLTLLWLVNITEQKENETDLQQAKSKAEASDRLKTAFLGNLSHEIRTPMNAIGGFASLLQQDELTEEKKSLYLTQILNGSTDLLQLIEKTIMISRIDLGQIKVNRRQFFVNQSLTDLIHKYEKILSRAGKEHIELVLEAGIMREDFVVQADRIHIMEVLNNLLENAVKFTSEGRITLGYAYLEEEAENELDALLFYVKDTGNGIAEDKRGIIFERFVKLVEKGETVLRGAGLGLAIAHDLVKSMGGDIWVESAIGDGSKFYFSIPIYYSKKQQSAVASPTPGKSHEDWSGFELLVAEDLESNYLYIKELLGPTQINIFRARDGLEAVEIFEKNPGIHIVLMDILMPGLDGYEATVQIRRIRKDIPVIAQTAFTFEGEIQDGLYAGCFTDYIMKPFTMEMLLANLKKHLPSK